MKKYRNRCKQQAKTKTRVRLNSTSRKRSPVTKNVLLLTIGETESSSVHRFITMVACSSYARFHLRKRLEPLRFHWARLPPSPDVQRNACRFLALLHPSTEHGRRERKNRRTAITRWEEWASSVCAPLVWFAIVASTTETSMGGKVPRPSWKRGAVVMKLVSSPYGS